MGSDLLRLPAEAEPFPVTRAEIWEVSLPLREPFVTGFGQTSTRRTVLLRLEDAEGHAGWGEGAALDHPFYLPETASSTYSVLVEHALPLVLEARPRSLEGVAAALAPIRGNNFAKMAVEAAYLALQAARAGVSLAHLLGGTASRIPVGESIGIKASLTETLEEVGLRLFEGYRRIKLKIRPGWDAEVVRAVRRRFGDIPLQVDANASYRLDDAARLNALDGFGLLCIEQPLGYDDIDGHAVLQRRLATPICLDESLRSVEQTRRALDIGACRNVNLKPGRVGGIVASLTIHDECRARSVPLWCGGMLESGIGRAPNIALCSLPGFVQPADMSPASVLYRDDVLDGGYEVDSEGFITVSHAPGLGYRVDDEKVRAWATRGHVVETRTLERRS
ncbi:MAG: o-succinylbenzoate synthase [Candidatus Dormibacteraceae bacterium]